MKALIAQNRLKRRRDRRPFLSYSISGRLAHGWVILVIDRALRDRGRYEIYFN